MNTIEQIIKEKGREQFYNYYKSLGYDHKVAASLALFTYGNFKYRKFSMDDLYEALCAERKYLPEERVREQVWQSSPAGGAMYSSAYEDDSMMCAPSGTESVRSASVFSSGNSSAPTGGRKFHHSLRMPSLAKSGMMLADESECLDEEACAPMAMSSAPCDQADMLGLAGSFGFSTDEYERIEEKDERRVVSEPTSTFRMTTNTASAGVILNQLRNGRRIDRSMVRIEEMLNYFRYNSKIPENDMFNIACELMDTDNDRKYLYVNVQGRKEVRDQQNIVILLDVSGSMCGNAEQTQAIIATIISKLKDGDKISLITYSDRDSVELEAFPVNGAADRIHVLEKLLSLEIDGCTYGSKGIESAYRIGKNNFIPGGNNQVIMITDGDLNFGITDKGGLEELIELKKKDNLFLSVVGTGLYNYKDDKLETLSKHGNGVYRVVNSLTDVKKSIDDEYASLVNIIAKDVKAQVEFNPEVVASYRLLGFENRALAREDFTNDKVISEPFGSGGYGVALYELKMKSGSAPVESGLKYSRIVTTASREMGTVKVRYKKPLEEVSLEMEKVIDSAEETYTDNLRLAFIVYVCAEKLRGSDKISAEEINLAQKLYQELGDVIREKNSADLYKLAGILEKSEEELGIGIQEDIPFLW